MLTLDAGGATWPKAPRDSRLPRRPKVSAMVEAVIAGGVGLLVLPGLGQLQRQVLVRSDALFVVGVLLSVVAALAVAGGAHRWLGGGRRRDAVAVGTVAALLAGTAWGAMAIAGGWELWHYLPPRAVLWSAALAAAVLAVRTDGVGARVAGGVAGTTAGLAVVSALQVGWPLLAAYLPVPSEPPARQVGLPGTEGEALPSPPVAPDASASPTFGDLCHPDELEMVAAVPEAGGNDVATTLTATNVGGRECLVEGWPTVHVLSDGADLALNVHVSETQPAGDHVEAVSVVLAPGASARTQVWWPSWGAAANLGAAQELRVGVGGGVEVVELAEDQRWDVVRSAEAWVAPWQPGEPAD